MKQLFLALGAFSLLLGGIPAVAAVPASLPSALAQQVDHGGGCRKASPPGKCCHAGKKPYHCH